MSPVTTPAARRRRCADFQLARAFGLALALLISKPASSSKATSPASPATASQPPSLLIPRTKGRTTGLFLPRFASLRADTVNLRVGPGTRYPINWVLSRRHLPVEITREYKLWRAIRLPDGTRGWVHQVMLSPRRSFLISHGRKTLRYEPRDSADAVAVLRSGVVGHILACEAGASWCHVEVARYSGFLKRSNIWGIYPGEVIQN